MRMPLLLAALVSLLPFSAPAAGPLTAASEACRCDPAVSDPFEQPVTFTSGALAGKCVDSCRFRAAKVLSEGQLLEVANVLHDGRFGIASLNPNGAYEVDVLLEQFLTAVNHLALRVRFAPDSPIRLRSQREEGSAFDQESHDLVISVEAALPPQGGFAFFNAKNGAYLLDYRLTTIEESRRWMLGVKKHNVRQFRLRVNPEAIAALVRLAAHNAETRSFEAPYYLLTSNCATTAFEMLDQVTGMKPPTGAAWAERAWPVDGPYGTLQYLYGSGLISARLPDLDKE